MNSDQNGARNAFQNASPNAHGTSLVGARAREPLHSTEEPTSSRNDAQTRGRADETATNARLREIHPLDALSIAVLTLRPDWSPAGVRAALARTKGSWTDVTRSALRAATNPDVRTPGAIENFDERPYEPTPVPPSLDEWRNAERCEEHGAIRGKCALCRRGIGAGA